MLNAELVVDLGNSQTRAVLRVGELHNNTRKEYSFELSNRFAIAYDGLPKSSDYNADNTTIFEIGDYNVGNREVVEGVYVNGLMSASEFESLEGKPSAQSKKYNSEYTMLSVFTAIAKSAVWIQNYFNEKQSQDLTLETVFREVNWDLNLLLPPSQVEKGGKVLAESLVGNFNVNYLMPEANTTVRINSVKVHSEGVMAYIAVLIKKSNKQVRQDKAFMLKSNVLVIDIGAGTTDIVLIKNNKPVENSKHTIDLGGNNIKSKLRQKVNKDLELSLPEAYYDDAVISGTIKKGNKEFDITGQLKVSKREVAQLINNEIQSFLDSASLSIQTVEYILVVGGGSINSKSPKIDPISKYILHGLQRFSPEMELIDISDITDQDGISLNNSDVVGTRELNVVGTEITLDLKELKEAKAKQLI